ncbi:hypothetical protein [Marinitoga aeolica]|uniref:Peptidase MA-like domain-containing protein n=1 Tax=Marinitoga aeolica TaxID=2809031 RepID=A0ABY8PS67_9BACT|nr:hypothetical protein [Marinitoga aeolica]WGS65476.1 hypothetical protein JRV97_02650 [Marinitoga aeolica]
MGKMKKMVLFLFIVLVAIISFGIDYHLIKRNEFILDNIKKYAEKNWPKVETKNLEIYFENDNEFSKYAWIVAQKEQEFLDRMFSFFNIGNVKKKAKVFILKDNELSAIMKVSGLAIRGEEIYTTPSVLRHELVHFVESQFPYEKYGKNYKKGNINSEILVEAIPQYFSSEYSTAYLNFIFKYGKLLNFENSKEILNEMSKNNNIYRYGPSFFEYLLSKYSIEEIKNLYVNLFTNVEEITGMNFDELVKDWIRWVREYKNNEFNGIYAHYYFYYLYYDKYIVPNIELQNIYNFKTDDKVTVYRNDIIRHTNNYIEIINPIKKEYKLFKGKYILDENEKYVITYDIISDIFELKIYDRETQKLLDIFTLENYRNKFPIGKIISNFITISNGKFLFFYNMYAKKIEKTIPYENIETIKNINDKIIIGKSDGTIDIIKDYSVQNTIKISDWFIKKILLTNKYLVVTSGFNKITFLDKDTYETVKVLYPENDYISTITSKNNYIYVLYLSGKILKINLNDFNIIKSINVGRVAYPEMGYLTDNLFIKYIDGYLRFYSLDNDIEENREYYKRFKNLKVFPDYIENAKSFYESDDVIVSYNKIGDYEIIENEFCEVAIRKNNKEILNIELYDYISNIKIEKDKLFISTVDGEVRVYDLKSKKLLFKKQTYQVAAEFDGDYIYYGNKDKEIVKYDYKNKNEIKKYYGSLGFLVEIKRDFSNKIMISYYSKDKFRNFSNTPSNKVIFHYNDGEKYLKSIITTYPIKKIIPYKNSYKILIEDINSNLFVYNILNGDMEKIIHHFFRKIVSIDINKNKLIMTDGKFIIIKDLKTGEEIKRYLVDKGYVNFVKWISENEFIYIQEYEIYKVKLYQ